jgi:hypothetical protein
MCKESTKSGNISAAEYRDMNVLVSTFTNEKITEHVALNRLVMTDR